MPLRLKDFLAEEQVIANLKGPDAEGVLSEIADNLAAANGLDSSSIKDALVAREDLRSTGIGNGVAIPHAKLNELERVVVGFGRSLNGVPYRAIDKLPVNFFFCILSTGKMTAVHLKVLARIATLVRKSSFREQLLACRDSHDLFQTIIAEDERS